MAYDIGDSIRLTVTFTSVINSTLVDPTNIKLTIKRPDLIEEQFLYPAIVQKESIGIYNHDYAIDQSGRFWYRWEGTGANPSAIEGYFIVKESQFS
jgi:hypothetical protein